MLLTLLQDKIGSGAATVTNNKVRFFSSVFIWSNGVNRKICISVVPFLPQSVNIFWMGFLSADFLQILLIFNAYFWLDLIEEIFTMDFSAFTTQFDLHLRPVLPETCRRIWSQNL